MSSDASSLPEQATDDSTHLDLRKVFSHPAGLRTARFIVASFIRTSQNRNAQSQHENFSSVSPPTFDSNPEVASLLNEILAFSESGNAASGSVGNSTATTSPDVNRGNMVGGRLPTSWGTNYSGEFRSDNLSASSSHSSHSERFRLHHSLAIPPFNTQTSIANSSSNYYPSNRHTPSQPSQQTQQTQLSSMQALPGIEVPSATRSSGSPFHGTESPYHVESPSGRSSTNTPQPMSRQSSSRHTVMSSLPNPESEPLRLDQGASYGSQFQASHVSNNPQMKLASGGYFAPLQAMSASRNQPNNNAASAFQSRLPQNSPHIKNFLPVNKGPSNNSKPEQHSVERTIAINNRPPPSLPPAASPISGSSHPAHSPVLISPHPGVNHPLFKAQNNNAPMEPIPGKKRKPKADGAPRVKRQKADKAVVKAKRVPKEKEEKPIPACQKLSDDLWMRILEFSPPHFLKKVRLWNRAFKEMVDGYDSLFVNQRMENFGVDIPVASMMGLTERQYTDLLGGKGCLEPGCTDKKASRTHWSWAKRWCSKCWQSKIEREDRILKARQHDFPQRQILTKLLECIPIGMHDSFMKAHDLIENLEARPSTAPRIYKYYIKAEVDTIIEEYQAFKLQPFKDDPTKSAAENASARTEHQQKEAEAAEKQSNFLDERKAKNDEHMQRVLKIEGAIRKKRQEDAQPYNKNREGRRELFLKRAAEEIPDVPATFVSETKAFKAATRIFRDAGTERGWQTLKPKIQKEWDDSAEKRRLESGERLSEDISTRFEQSQDNQTSSDSSSRGDSQSQTNQNQLLGLGPQRFDQTDIQNFMADRANNMMTSGGMFGSLYNGNIYGRATMSSLPPSIFTTSGLGSSFLDTTSQFHSQSANLNDGLPNMSNMMTMDFNTSYQNNAYMHLPQVPNNNNFFGSGSAAAQPGKITVNSLLADPAPGASIYDNFQ